MTDTIFSAFLQLLAFTTIPFVVYVIGNKTMKGFFDYIGLKRSNSRANLYGLLIALLVGGPFLLLAILSPEFHEILNDGRSVSGSVKSIDNPLTKVISIGFTAIIKTALAEEILFRGFLAKRLITVAGFRTGNAVQAVIFGSIHAFLFMTITENYFFIALIFVVPTIGAYLKAYVNEKIADGSIIPGWIAHASGNVLSYSMVAIL